MTMNTSTQFEIDPCFSYIPLDADQPLFGMSKGNYVLIDDSKDPQPGDLVLFNDGEHSNIYRYELIGGVCNLWPGNKSVPLSWLGGKVIRYLVKEIQS